MAKRKRTETTPDGRKDTPIVERRPLLAFPDDIEGQVELYRQVMCDAVVNAPPACGTRAYVRTEDYTPHQWKFFKAIEEVAEEVLDTLQDEILPEYVRSFERFLLTGVNMGGGLITFGAMFDRMCDADNCGLRHRKVASLTKEVWHAIGSWGRRFRLLCKEPSNRWMAAGYCPLRRMVRYYERLPGDSTTVQAECCGGEPLVNPDPNDVDRVFGAKWVGRAVLRTLHAWYEDPALAEAKPRRWVMPPPVMPDGTEPTTAARKYTIELDGWDPRIEDMPAAVELLEKQAREKIWDEVAADEARLSAFGMVKNPVKHSLEHYRWLALYQVKGMSYAAIAKKELGISPDDDELNNEQLKEIKKWSEMIRFAVRTTAELVVGPGAKK